MNETIQYKVNGGKIAAIIQEFIELRASQRKARNAMEKEFGAKGCYANDREVSGFVFSTPPEGWRQVRTWAGVFKPPLTKDGKEIIKRMKQLPLAGAREFQAMILGEDNPFRFMTGLHIHYMTFEQVGTATILHVPKSKQPAVEDNKNGWHPPDSQCELLKTSQYWELKEAAE